jgi:UDP:flavonoid glycosyltransferase YjiC (YdhE family)
VIHVPPIVLIKEEEMLEKEEARNRLGIPESAEVWYVQLGAGQINDIESEIRITVDTLLAHNEHSIVVIGESLLGRRVSFANQRVRILRDYPNAIYFKGFDYSIQAGGYNSFHEMRYSQIPTIFYPNMNTGMDDQLARCKVAEEEGWGIVVEKRDAKLISQAIKEVVNIDADNENQFPHHQESLWITELLVN